MENICIIYDNDEVYAKRLMGMLSEDVRLQLAIWIFTDRERLIECIQVHADNVGLIIAGENIYGDPLAIAVGNSMSKMRRRRKLVVVGDGVTEEEACISTRHMMKLQER